MFEDVPELARLSVPFTAVKVSLSDNPFPDLHAMHEHWRGLCAGRFAPSRDAFDPTEVPAHILPKIMMVDIRDEPRDFVYRYWGTGVTDLHGTDMTGRSVREVKPSTFAEMIWGQYEEVVETGVPWLYAHKLPVRGGGLWAHATLRLPFSSDGKTVDIVMSVDDYGDAKSDLKEFFESAEGRQSE